MARVKWTMSKDGVVRVTRRITVRIRKDWVDWLVKESGKSETAVLEFLTKRFDHKAMEVMDMVPAVRDDGTITLVDWDEIRNETDLGSKVMPV